MDIDLNRYVAKELSISFNDFAGSVYIYNEMDSTIYELRDTARDIWLEITGLHTIKKLIESLCQKYNVEKDTLTSDIVYFLNQLENSKLIVVSPNPFERRYIDVC